MKISNFDFDVIVIGSGFGGSVMTCRLAEKGYRVCLLERGMEYGFNEFPRRIDEFKRAFWDPKDKLHGLFEVLAHKESDVFTVTGSGLGGGSLIYSNVLMPMDAEFFHGWPGGISRNVLDPYYDKVLKTMEASPYPFDDPYYADTPKTCLLKKAVSEITKDHEASQPPVGFFPHLALCFKGNFPGEQSLNEHGRVQSRCKKCGECNIGCNIHSKNTLDLNYIARARNKALLGETGVPAEIRTNAQVMDIKPLDAGGYEVRYKDPRDTNSALSKKLSASNVIISCGSIGTTTLLLKLKKGSLPKLSNALGKGWCGNGDLEATIFNTRTESMPTTGPVITYAIKYSYPSYQDGFPHGIFIEDGGLPRFLAWFIAGKMPSPGLALSLIKIAWDFLIKKFKKNHEVNMGDEIAKMLDNDDYIRRTVVLLGMGRDRSDGKIELSDEDEAIVKWRVDNSSLHLERQKREMARLANTVGGKLLLNPFTYLDKLISVHPLGGCVMADDPEHGVVKPYGEVFGYPGLYVVDGSIIPTSTGANPSLTIAAMAERIAEKFTKGRNK